MCLFLCVCMYVGLCIYGWMDGWMDGIYRLCVCTLLIYSFFNSLNGNTMIQGNTHLIF